MNEKQHTRVDIDTDIENDETPVIEPRTDVLRADPNEHRPPIDELFPAYPNPLYRSAWGASSPGCFGRENAAHALEVQRT
jgi:hypothetical protein